MVEPQVYCFGRTQHRTYSAVYRCAGETVGRQRRTRYKNLSSLLSYRIGYFRQSLIGASLNLCEIGCILLSQSYLHLFQIEFANATVINFLERRRDLLRVQLCSAKEL